MLNAFSDLLCSKLCWHNRRVPIRLESIMLQNLPIMLLEFPLILCFLDMDYADISYFKWCNLAENYHGKNEIDL